MPTEKEINQGLQETLDKQKKDKQKKDEELKKMTGSGTASKAADAIIKHKKDLDDIPEN
jgi:hypothetical protein